MYVSVPLKGSVGSNVNRWRTLDAGLRKVSEVEAAAAAKETTAGSLKVFRVDLKGPGATKKGGPFMGG